MDEAIKTLGKHGFYLDEYKGEWSLIAAYEGQDGKLYKTWGKAKMGKTAYSDKDRPFKVILGDKKMAVAALQRAIEELSDTPF